MTSQIQLGGGGARTSVLTQKNVVADWPRFGEGVELVEPFPGDVELQQAGLLHVGQSHHLLPLPHRLLAAFSEREEKENGKMRAQAHAAEQEKSFFCFFFAPVKQHVGLRVLHHRLVDFRHILVVKLVPLAVDDVLAVSDVVATCVESGDREGEGGLAK